MVKLPHAPPLSVLQDVPPDVKEVPAGASFLRIYALGGRHPGAWNGFRHWGPHPAGGRFDHHLPPPSLQARGVLYLATGPLTCFAEYFQVDRTIHRRLNAPHLVGFDTVRGLRLLNLTGLWPTRAGASAAITSGPRPRAQGWARAIYAAYPTLDGIWYGSSMAANSACVALTERAVSALPARPATHHPLADPLLDRLVRICAEQISYEVLD